MNISPITRLLGRTALRLKSASPTVLMVGGVVGVVGTVIVASRATLQLEEHIDKLQSEVNIVKLAKATLPAYTENDYRKDLVGVYTKGSISIAKLYAPAFTLGVLSVSCLLGSHNIMSKRNVALTAAYKSVEKAYDKYRERVADLIGVEEEKDLYRRGRSTKKYGLEQEDGTVVDVVETAYRYEEDGSPYARLWDAKSSTQWQANGTYNEHFLRAQQAFFNDRLKRRGHLVLNEVYEAIGLAHTKQGAVVGWIWDGDGDNYVDIGVIDAAKLNTQGFWNPDIGVQLDFNVDGIIYDKI